MTYKISRAFRGFEQLSISICSSSHGCQNFPWQGKLYLLWNVFIFIKSWVFEP